MMIYHASNQADWEFDPLLDSRYGFPVIFFSTDDWHVDMYASNVRRQFGQSFVHEREIDIKSFPKVYDFAGKSSYSINFKAMIKRLFKSGVPGAVIKDVVDVPSKAFDLIRTTDIVVVFRF